MKNVEVTYTSTKEILEKFDKMTGDGVSRLIKAHARICCVQLALRTQPFSVGQPANGPALEAGKNRVKYDIDRVIRSDEKLHAIADKFTDEKIQERLRAMINAGDYETVEKILKKTKVAFAFGPDSEILKNKAAIKTAHTRNRNKRSGRTYKKSDKFYLAKQRTVDSYIREASKRVGRSKAGWADCARRINAVKGDGARGIPAWAKSKNHGSNGSISDRSAIRPFGFVEMNNQVPWVSRLIPPIEVARAQNFARDMMIKSLKRSFTAAAKKEGRIEDTIDREVQAT